MTSTLAVTVDLELAAPQNTGGDSFHLQVELAVAGMHGISGPSGAGKSSLLRCIAGLPLPAKGKPVAITALHVHLGHNDLTHLPPEKRRIGMVFQDSRLFSHLTVAGNLRFAINRAATKINDDELASLVEQTGISTLLEQQSGSLSGGERQRVALARALAAKPDILLLDEPLSALDSNNRNQLLAYLQEQVVAMDIPALIVSHDLNDLIRITDQIVYMESGRVLTHGTPENIGGSLDLGTSGTDDVNSIISAQVLGFDADAKISTLATATDSFKIPGETDQSGKQLQLTIAAERVALSKTQIKDSSMLNQIPVRLDSQEYQEDGTVIVRLALNDGQFLLSHVTSYSFKQLDIQKNDTLYALVQGIVIA